MQWVASPAGAVGDAIVVTTTCARPKESVEWDVIQRADIASPSFPALPPDLEPAYGLHLADTFGKGWCNHFDSTQSATFDEVATQGEPSASAFGTVE